MVAVVKALLSLFLTVSSFFSGVFFPPREPQPGDYNLLIIHTNDVHAHISEFTPELGLICLPELDTGKQECIGGVPRRVTAIEDVLGKRGESLYSSDKEARNWVLLDAGDEFQGTLYFNVYQGNESSHFMSYIDYDAFVLGNHEFDSGTQVLSRFMDNITTPIVTANIDVSEDPYMSKVKNLAPYTILERDGQKIGIIGVIVKDIPELSNPGPYVKFSDPAEAMRKYIKELKEEQGVTKIIALTHIGYEDDKKLAQDVEGIDVIVGGHSHTYLGPDSPYPYPTMVENSKSKKQVCVVQAKCWGIYLGTLDVTWDAEGNLVGCKGEPIYMDKKYAQNETILEDVYSISGPVVELMTQPVGRSTHALESETCRSKECILGSIVADALRAQAESLLLDKMPIHAAVINGGGLRSGIPQNVTWGAILGCMPFENELHVVPMKGEVLLKALEHSIANLPETSGGFLQVSGLQVRYKEKNAPKERVISVQIHNTTTGKWTEVQEDTEYNVAMTSFIKGGGDGYSMFKALKSIPMGPEITDAFSTKVYFEKNSPVKTGLEKRVSEKTSGTAVAAIIVGSILGVLALSVAVLAAVYWIKHRGSDKSQYTEFAES